MSSLTEFRDHCRKMARSEHKSDCPSLGPRSFPVWEPVYDIDETCPSGLRYMGHTPPPPECGGCLSGEERALFAQLAGEVDAYLAPQVDLFGEVAHEPTEETA